MSKGVGFMANGEACLADNEIKNSKQNFGNFARFADINIKVFIVFSKYAKHNQHTNT